MKLFEQSGPNESLLQRLSDPQQTVPDYTSTINRNDITNTLYKNPAFLEDVYAEANAEGVDLYSDEEAVRWFQHNRSWKNISPWSMGKEWLSADDRDEASKARLRRLRAAWQASPNFYEASDARSFGEKVADLGVPMLLDPINIIPLSWGAQATKVATIGGKTGWQAIKEGTKKAAITEGGIEAGYGTTQNLLDQHTGIKIDERDKFNFSETALEAGAGFILGAGFGGLISAPLNLYQARSTRKRNSTTKGCWTQ